MPPASRTLAPEDVIALREYIDRTGEYDFVECPYTEFQARRRVGKLVITVYSKQGKLLVQGRDADQFMRNLEGILDNSGLSGKSIEQPIPTPARALARDPGPLVCQTILQPHIGVDESGKGDLFGPLVIAGAYLRTGDVLVAEQLGIRDSKKLSDEQCQSLATKIKNMFPCSMVCISPEKYNKLYKEFRNLNDLLAWGHARVIENLLEKVPECKLALSDQFAANKSVLEGRMLAKGRLIELRQVVRGESDLAVACASVVARHAFVGWLSNAKRELGISMPKGCAGHVKAAAYHAFTKLGIEGYAKLVKLHFRTNEDILRGVDHPYLPEKSTARPGRKRRADVEESSSLSTKRAKR